jgi:hypothetical protein
MVGAVGGSGAPSTFVDNASRHHVHSLEPDVRESLRLLPAALQLPLTLLTGKPYHGQQALRLTPATHLIAAVISIVSGLALSWVALSGWIWLWLLVPGWAMTLHGMRNLRMMIYHQCAHRNMWARTKPDLMLGKIVAGLLIVQDFEGYSREHVADHHALHHMTLRDPTVQAMLVSLELRAGMTRAQMWRKVRGKLVSPKFHASFLTSRVRSYFAAAGFTARAMTVIIYLGVAAIVTAFGLWPYVAIAWIVPLTVFFQVSNVLRLCVKHTFPAAGTERRRSKEYLASLTNAIFLGDPVPTATSSRVAGAFAWLRWTARMAFVHLPARYLVLTGDTVCHDFHHRHPMSRDWSSYIFARQADLESGHRGWPPYREVWGLVQAINVVFDSLSAADEYEFDLAAMPAVSRYRLYAAFDD